MQRVSLWLIIGTLALILLMVGSVVVQQWDMASARVNRGIGTSSRAEKLLNP